MKRVRSFLPVLSAASISWLLMVGAISLALIVPTQELFRGFGAEGSLDYSAHRSGFFIPLTRGFISRVLGLGPEETRSREVERAQSLRGSGSSGSRTILEHPFTNDHFKESLQIHSIPFTAKTNTSKATRQLGEPDGCSPVGGTVWYRYRPPSDVGLVANTIGTNYSTAIAVLKGSELDNLASVGCDTDARGNAHVVFPARAGTTYYFQITGLVSGGDLIFNLDPLGVTSRVSVSSTGTQSESTSRIAAISADGRYAIFGSWSNGLVPGDDNFMYDVFVHDRANRATTLVSVNSSGEPGNDHSWMGAASADGRYIAFVSYASNLVPGDTNGQADMFVHDRLTRSTTRVSVASDGTQGSTPPIYDIRECYSCFQETRGDRPYLQYLEVSISGDGRYVAFDSDFQNLVPDDTNGRGDVFVHDRLTESTTRASVSSSEKETDGFSDDGRISPDGRYVVFSSSGSNLVSSDSNEVTDVFIRDLRTGTTSKVSMSSSGGEGDAESSGPSVSSEGRYVAFVSYASNLVPGDTNELPDMFVRDRETGTTTRVSVSSAGEEQLHTGFQFGPDIGLIGEIRGDISGDGRRVAFYTSGANLVPDDQNGLPDVFVHDRVSLTTTRASVSSAGKEADGTSSAPRLSQDGLIVIFDSGAENLVQDDSNGQQDIFVHEFSVLR